jgi:hypothetical protein
MQPEDLVVDHWKRPSQVVFSLILSMELSGYQPLNI